MYNVPIVFNNQKSRAAALALVELYGSVGVWGCGRMGEFWMADCKCQIFISHPKSAICSPIRPHPHTPTLPNNSTNARAAARLFWLLKTNVDFVQGELVCNVPCFFGEEPGFYQFRVGAEGYVYEVHELSAAYAISEGDCPSFREGPVRLNFGLRRE